MIIPSKLQIEFGSQYNLCFAFRLFFTYLEFVGQSAPSLEDIRVTRDICEAGALLDIDLLDHVIIGDGRYTSMKEKKLGF